jgi:hypothetical protein
MKTDWLFQEPIDLEHKQYVLLDYLQKLDKNLNNLKLYPHFQEISLHLASINLLIEKGQYILLNKTLKEPDDEILISDLVSVDCPIMTKEDILEIYHICKFTTDKLTDYFNHAKAIWDIVNDTVSISTVQNPKSIEPKQGLFFLDYNNKTLLYEFIIKPIKKNSLETKCQIKKICECDKKDFSEKLKSVKRSLIKNLQNEEVHSKLIVFTVNHSDNFPLKETLLPIVKRKIMNYMIQSKIIRRKNLTSNI